MKMTQDHLDLLQKGIDNLFDVYSEEVLVEAYETGQIGNADKVKDLQKRFCFDLFYATGIKIGDGVGTQGDIIGNYSDAHVYTALKSICPTVTKRF